MVKARTPPTITSLSSLHSHFYTLHESKIEPQTGWMDHTIKQSVTWPYTCPDAFVWHTNLNPPSPSPPPCHPEIVVSTEATVAVPEGTQINAHYRDPVPVIQERVHLPTSATPLFIFSPTGGLRFVEALFLISFADRSLENRGLLNDSGYAVGWELVPEDHRI